MNLSSTTARLRARPVYTAIATVFVVLKVIYAIRSMQSNGHGGSHLIFGSDTPTYSDASKLALWSKDFYEAPGPFGFLLLFKLVGRSFRALVVAQTAISIAAWLALALSVRSAMHTAIGQLVGFAGVLATGLAPAFVMYDVAFATESLALSLAAVVLALAIRLAVRADRRTVIGFVVAFAAAAFTHDLNALLAGIVGVAALVALVVPRVRAVHARRLLACGLVLVVVAGIEVSLSNAARRWYWPTAETLVLRVAEDPAGLKWLVDHGMPNDVALGMLQSNYYLTYPGFQADIPPYQPLRHWLDTRGRSTYTEYLVTHPGYVVTKPLDSLAEQFDPNVDNIANAQDMRADPVTRVVGRVGVPTFRVEVLWAVVAFLGVGFAMWSVRERRRLGWTILGIGALVVPHALAAFHGDALELGRHSLSAALHARVIVWIATAYAIDVLLERRRGATHVEVATSTDDPVASESRRGV